MPKRRGHGEGSIYHQKDGRWVAELYLGRDDAGKKRVWKVYGKTRREVAEELTKVLREHHQGLPVDATKQTLGQFLSQWMDNVVRGNVRPTTFEVYGNALRHAEAILDIPLAKLTPQQLQRLYREKLDSGLGRTVAVLHAVLHQALNRAVKWGLVPRNVADTVEPPKVQSKQFRALTPEEAARFLKVASDDRLYALYVLAITCGLRFGELLGLRWEDVDLEKGTLTVRHQLQRIDGKPGLAAPKTPRSRRTIRLPTTAIAALKKHRSRQLGDRLFLGEVWRDWGLVFSTEIGTPLNESNVRNRSFYPLLKKAGLPRMRFHDLRHTCATLLLAEGVHPKLVQEQLGHSQIRVTLDIYSHVTPTMMDEVAAKMDSILAAAEKKRR